MEPIEWRRNLEDSPTARLFAYVLVGSATGLGLLLGLLFLVALPGIVVVLWHNPAMAALVALFVFVGGPISLSYVWPLLTDRSQRRPLLENSMFATLPPSGILVATVVGACVHALLAWFLSIAPVLVLAAGAVVGGFGTGLFCTEGRIDPEARTLTVGAALSSRDSGGRTVDLTTWAGFTEYRWRSLALVRPRYGRGGYRSNPRLIPMPATVADAARPVFEAAVDAETPESERPPNPTVAATLVAFGLGTIAFGVATVLLEVGPGGYRAYVFALAVLLGAVFLGAAWREY